MKEFKMYTYNCACCNSVLTYHAKECNHCGSHHIRSPINSWIFCIFACLAVVITLKLVHIYTQSHHEVPVQQSLLEILNKSK